MVESYKPSDLSPGMQRNILQCMYWEGPYSTQAANAGIPLVPVRSAYLLYSRKKFIFRLSQCTLHEAKRGWVRSSTASDNCCTHVDDSGAGATANDSNARAAANDFNVHAVAGDSDRNVCTIADSSGIVSVLEPEVELQTHLFHPL